MCNLGVEDAVAVDAVLIDEGRAILAEVVENFYNVRARQNLLQIAAQSVIKWIHALQVENVAVVLEAELEQCDWFALDQAFAVEAKDGWRVTGHDFATDSLNELRRLNERVVLDGRPLLASIKRLHC